MGALRDRKRVHYAQNGDGDDVEADLAADALAVTGLLRCLFALMVAFSPKGQRDQPAYLANTTWVVPHTRRSFTGSRQDKGGCSFFDNGDGARR